MVGFEWVAAHPVFSVTAAAAYCAFIWWMLRSFDEPGD